MKTSSRSGSKRRWSLRRFIRRGGWVVFWSCIVLTIVWSTFTDHLVSWPALTGVVVLAVTQIVAWLMKRNRQARSGHAGSRSSGAGGSRPTRAASASSAAVISDFSPARDERPLPRRRGSTDARPGVHAAGAGYWRKPLKVLVVCALALPVVALVALWMCFEDAPRVVQRSDLSLDSYENVQKLIETHDPRNAAGGGVRTLVASQEEVNLLLGYAGKRFHNAALRVALLPGAAVVQGSVYVPSSPFGQWLNFDAVLRQTSALPKFSKLTLGSLPVPAFVADFGLEQFMSRFNASEQGRIAKEMVKSVTLSQSQVKVVYEWREDLVTRARATLISPEDQARFHAYSDRLFETIDRSRRSPTIALSNVLPPMFQLAKQRSAESDAAKENRAAIITLAFFAFGRDLSTIIPAAASWRAPVPVQLTLYDRDDTAQHFLVSAALAIEGGSALTDAIGVYREVDDSKRTGKGKGFSFQDLAADRAGTRFGTLAASSAQKLQRIHTVGVKDADFMPPFTDLAEEIPEAEFKTRYGGVGSPTYNNILAEIESRVARTPLLR